MCPGGAQSLGRQVLTIPCGVLCQRGPGSVGRGAPNSARGVRDGISEKVTIELRLEGGRGVGLVKEVGMMAQAEGPEYLGN